MEERLQKLLAGSGLCSRRKAEEYILAGRVTVNGRVAQLGDRGERERDEILLDGQPIGQAPHTLTLLLYKPRGIITTLEDEKGRPTVAKLVADCGVRVWPVGRLDGDSEGLLLMTNDGALTHALLHPSHEVEKEYLVWVEGYTPQALRNLGKPLTLDGQRLHPARVRRLRQEGSRTVLSVVIHEGKNRQVRRMCAQCGLTVHRLKRVREGTLALDPALRPGQWRPLSQEELEGLTGKVFCK